MFEGAKQGAGRAIYLIAVLSFLCSLSACVVVEDGTEGIGMSFGKISDDVLKPGLHANVPLFHEVEVWNVKTQRASIPVEILSGEGLTVSLEATILFRPTNVVRLRKLVGVDYVRKVLVSTLVDTFRQVIGKQRVEEVIKSQEKLTTQVQAEMVVAMGERGILVEELLVTAVGLPEKFKRAVEIKLESEQKALQKEFELQQAKKDAEIEIARARGAAQAQEIVRKTLSASYLQYLWISTLNQNPNVIYVATEANMPVFRTMSDPTRKSVRIGQGLKADG